MNIDKLNRPDIPYRPSKIIVNVLSIDLEDYYMVSAFESVVKREDWNKYESRIERNTYHLLEIISGAKPPSLGSPDRPDQFKTQNSKLKIAQDAAYDSPTNTGVHATFFCLGWIAERYPYLIRDISSLGHEIANHGYDHRLVYNMTPAEFRNDIRKSKRILEDITGREVIGYRAPSCSITMKALWAIRILAEEGYRYDSSIFPIHHDRYGIPHAPRFPFVISLDGERKPILAGSLAMQHRTAGNPKETFEDGKRIIEFPLSTVKFFGVNAPVSGGGYMRLLPYQLIRRAINRINEQEDNPFTLYLHPWEIDPDQPRMNGISAVSRFRHYVNLGRTEQKLKKLLNDFAFSTMKNVIGFQS